MHFKLCEIKVRDEVSLFNQEQYGSSVARRRVEFIYLDDASLSVSNPNDKCSGLELWKPDSSRGT